MKLRCPKCKYVVGGDYHLGGCFCGHVFDPVDLSALLKVLNDEVLDSVPECVMWNPVIWAKESVYEGDENVWLVTYHSHLYNVAEGYWEYSMTRMVVQFANGGFKNLTEKNKYDDEYDFSLNGPVTNPQQYSDEYGKVYYDVTTGKPGSDAIRTKVCDVQRSDKIGGIAFWRAHYALNYAQQVDGCYHPETWAAVQGEAYAVQEYRDTIVGTP